MWHLDINTGNFSMTEVAQRIAAYLAECRCPEGIIFAIHLVVEELLTNVACHGHSPEIRLGIEMTAGHVLLEVVDSGVPFNPLEYEVQGLDQAFADREVGGMGIYLVKEMMDELSYTYKDGKNRLRAVKQFAP